MPPPANEGRERGLAWMALVLLAWVPMWRLVIGQGWVVQHDFFLSDLLHQNVAIGAEYGRRLAAGELPLWWSGVFSGVPMWMQPEMAPLWPVKLLYVVLDPWTATNLTLVAQVALAGAGTWLLCRQLGAGPVGAAFAGIAFAYGGFSISHFRHPNMHAAAAMLPWMVFAAERAWQTRDARWWPALGMATAGSALTGMPQVTYMALCTVAAWLLVRSVPGMIARERRTAVHLAMGGAALGLGLAASAVTLLPAWQFTPFSPRAGGAAWEHITTQANGLDLLTIFLSFAAGDPLNGTYSGGTYPWDVYAYCGVLTPILALFGFLRTRDRGLKWIAGLAIGLCLLLMLGKATPFFGLLWSVVPGFSLWRLPGRWTLILQLMLVVMAGVGLTELVRSRPAKLGLIAFLVVDLWWSQAPHAPIDDLEAWRRPTSAVADAIDRDGYRTYHLDDATTWLHTFETHEGFRDGMGPFRALAEVPLGSLGTVWGLSSPAGYVNLPDQRAMWFWHPIPIFKQHDLLPAPQWEAKRVPAGLQSMLDRASVRWVVSTDPVEQAGYHRVAALDGRSVYRNDGALPRAYVATEWRPVDDIERHAAWIQDLGSTRPAVPSVQTTAAPSAPGAPIVAAALTERSPEHLEIDVSASGAGWLIVSDTWSPGWTATVDGQPVDIAHANGWQRAVWLDEGARQVTMRFVPPGLVVGAVISGLSITAIIGWLAVAWRRRRD
jgi:hypothetical protein